MKLQGRKILLFVDNCSAHPHVDLSNVNLMFLPPNTTSRLQPCDAGIIATFKAHYRKRLLRHVLTVMDDVSSATDLSKRVDVKDAISWASLAWSAVTDTNISKCFAKCGFRESDTTSEPDTPTTDDNDDQARFEPLMGNVSWEDYIAMDNQTFTTPDDSTDWEATLLAKARGEHISSDEESAHEEEEQTPVTPSVTPLAAYNYMQHVIDLGLQLSHPDLLESAIKVQNILQEIRLKQSSAACQKKMSDFFQPRQ